MARKTPHKAKEASEIQKLKQENKLLKRKVNRLTKMLRRVDDENRMQFLTELVDAQRLEDRELYETVNQEKIRKKWQCFKCEEGVIKLQIFNRMDGVFYYRRCDCGHKTKMKKYHEGVEE